MKYNIRIKKFIGLFILALVIFAGCDMAENTDFTDSAILQSYLQPGDTFSLRIGRQIPFDTTVVFSTDDINNLNITLNYNSAIHQLTPLGNGLYSNSEIHLQEGDNYSVEFIFDSKTVNASTHIPDKPIGFSQSDTVIYVERQTGNQQGQTNTSATVDFTWTNTDNSYYFLMIENIEPTLDPIVSETGGRAPKGFRKTPTNSDFDQLRGGDFTYFGRHRVVLFHVLNDYAALYQQNSNSSQNLTNSSSSITNGYGIFTGINSDTLYINIKPL